MQSILAVALLTLKAAIRFRLLIVLSALLLLTVVGLPLVLKDDGTAQGFTQILLTYTLSLITALLGLATLWIACGTLARDIEEYQMQIVAVKPVPRWQVWLGKWLGIMILNGVLLSMSGTAVFFLMQYRSAKLPEAQQATLRDEIFVARGSAKEELQDYGPMVDQYMANALESNPELANSENRILRSVREMLKQQVIASQQVVPPNPGIRRRWQMKVAPPEEIKDQPLYLRVKFFTGSAYDTATYIGFWEIGPPEGARRVRIENSISPESPIQFEIPPNLVDADGVLTVDFANLNDKPLMFPLGEKGETPGVEVLYKKGSFAPNFARGIILIYCSLGFLCALGLMAASFLSFPVAAFFSLALLFVGFCHGTLEQIVYEGGITGVDSSTGKTGSPGLVDKAAVGMAKGMLFVINSSRHFFPVENLSDGRMITWRQMFQSILQIVILGGGIFACAGMVIFTKRELATAKSF